MNKQWRIHQHDADRIRAIEKAINVPAVVAQLLVSRGLDNPETAQRFLDPRLSHLRDPDDLPGAATAAARIEAAVQAGHRITVYGDYDVDGITATAILYRCLRLLGADAGYYLPNRLDEGYGLSADALRKLAAQGTKQVVTVDAGITATAEAAVARELGIELIITDHHLPGETLPEAAAIVHPGLPTAPYPFAGLSGSGVALKLAWSLCRRVAGADKVTDRMRDFLMQAVGLASLGTVADVVPLVDENRVLVRHGLTSLTNFPTIGITALCRVAELDQKSALNTEDIGFALAPRMNAAGRLGQAQLALELLVTDNPTRASELADYINELNGSRQHLERSIYRAANKQAQEEFDPESDAALVLAGRGWHAGVIGIVAGRLAEKYHRPVVVCSIDELGVKPCVGSARSIRGFDLHAALAACDDHLLTHGGHAAAAGVKVEEASLDAFRQELCEQVANRITHEDLVSELWIDAEVPLSGLTKTSIAQMEQLAPFGQDNPRPLLCTSEVTLAEAPKQIGGGGRHLSLKVAQHGVTLRAVSFGSGERIDEFNKTDTPWAIAFRPVINEFRGRRTVEIQMVDWQPAESLVASV